MGNNLGKITDDTTLPSDQHINDTTFGKTIKKILEAHPENKMRACCVGTINSSKSGSSNPLIIKVPDVKGCDFSTSNNCIITKTETDGLKATCDSSNITGTCVPSVIKKLLPFKDQQGLDEDKKFSFCSISNDGTGDSYYELKSTLENNLRNTGACDNMYKNFCAKRMKSQNCYIKKADGKYMFDSNNPYCIESIPIYSSMRSVVEDDCACINSEFGSTLNTPENIQQNSVNVYGRKAGTGTDSQQPQIFDDRCKNTALSGSFTGNNKTIYGKSYRLGAYNNMNANICFNQIVIGDNQVEGDIVVSENHFNNKCSLQNNDSPDSPDTSYDDAVAASSAKAIAAAAVAAAAAAAAAADTDTSKDPAVFDSILNSINIFFSNNTNLYITIGLGFLFIVMIILIS
jgi:hypothetical protein